MVPVLHFIELPSSPQGISATYRSGRALRTRLPLRRSWGERQIVRAKRTSVAPLPLPPIVSTAIGPATSRTDRTIPQERAVIPQPTRRVVTRQAAIPARRCCLTTPREDSRRPDSLRHGRTRAVNDHYFVEAAHRRSTSQRLGVVHEFVVISVRLNRREPPAARMTPTSLWLRRHMA